MTTSSVNALPDTPCYLNGEYTALKDAKISVLDRGFIFGDGIYEVVPAYAGKLFRFEQHMARLERSLTELRIPNPLTLAEWRQVSLKLIADYVEKMGAAAANGNQLIYIQISRGVAMRDHPMLPGLSPTVFVMVNTMKLPSEQQREQGVTCVTADDFRWEKAHIKSTSLLGAVFSRQISVDAGALETIMFRGDYLSEASSSNVWVVKDGKVSGPPKDKLVLEGIRYGLIEEMCRAAGIDFELRRISRAEVLAADELMLSSATKEVLPVTLLDGQPVGNGKPGPVYAKLYAAYQQAKQALSS
ncbi:D-alanine transaminase [Polaromonas sp. OV174]|uniref:D-amino acid aminotransferase n=1 Tax=Polaromonas sp. OV174 TaxID=1855300 RepID=UPI0008F3A6D1|nr:D-amino acid aminotransferase [Polaromonas sp. OV174]SFC08355.1 D-alanine transaminase [Polaromonas sp. OV174]